MPGMKPDVFLVVGSNCFTGSHIVDALLENPSRRVIGVSRSAEYNRIFLPYKARPSPNFEFRRLDIVTQMDRLLELLAGLRPRVVINAAAQSEVALSHESPAEYYETNTLAVARLTDFLRRQAWLERYVHISSAEIFGACAQALDETALFNPSTPYAVSKAAADMHINTLIKNFAFRATLIRSTNVHGRHQQLFKIIPRSIINIKLGIPIELHGGGAAKKNFVHIRDVVNGILSAVEKGAAGTYHFSDKNGLSTADVVRLICELMGADFSSGTCVVGERLGQDSRYVLDWSKARKELGWRPRVAFRQGVRETIDWIEGHWEAIRKEPRSYIHRVSKIPTPS